MRRLAVALGGVLLVAAITVWWWRGDQRAPAPARDEGSAAGAATRPLPGPTAVGSGSAVTPSRTRRPGDPVNGFGAPGRLAKLPDHYELTAGNGVSFVDLGGGKSSLTTYRTPEVVPRHPLVVTVLDRARAPLSNAIVLLEKELTVMGAGLGARASGTTDTAGKVTIDVPNEALHAVAIHHDGWTAVADIAADATELELVLAGRGALEGRATYNRHAETFALYLTSGVVRIMYETDPDGTYKIASLPPGTWSVKCGLAQDITGGASKQDEKTIVIEDGKTATANFDQLAGTTIVAEVSIAKGTADPPIIQAFLFPGSAVAPDAKTVRDRARAEKIPYLLFGGVDAMKPIQFHDIAPGSYLVCEAAGASIREPPTLFGCAPVSVLDGDTVREVKLPLR